MLKLNNVREIWLYVGHHAWRYAKNRHLAGHPVLILPKDKLAEDYHWQVQKKEVLIFDCNPQGTEELLLKQLAWQLLIADAAVVRLVRTMDVRPLVVFYRAVAFMGKPYSLSRHN